MRKASFLYLTVLFLFLSCNKETTKTIYQDADNGVQNSTPSPLSTKEIISNYSDLELADELVKQQNVIDNSRLCEKRSNICQRQLSNYKANLEKFYSLLAEAKLRKIEEVDTFIEFNKVKNNNYNEVIAIIESHNPLNNQDIIDELNSAMESLSNSEFLCDISNYTCKEIEPINNYSPYGSYHEEVLLTLYEIKIISDFIKENPKVKNIDTNLFSLNVENFLKMENQFKNEVKNYKLKEYQELKESTFTKLKTNYNTSEELFSVYQQVNKFNDDHLYQELLTRTIITTFLTEEVIEKIINKSIRVDRLDGIILTRQTNTEISVLNNYIIINPFFDIETQEERSEVIKNIKRHLRYLNGNKGLCETVNYTCQELIFPKKQRYIWRNYNRVKKSYDAIKYIANQFNSKFFEKVIVIEDTKLDRSAFVDMKIDFIFQIESFRLEEFNELTDKVYNRFETSIIVHRDVFFLSQDYSLDAPDFLHAFHTRLLMTEFLDDTRLDKISTLLNEDSELVAIKMNDYIENEFHYEYKIINFNPLSQKE